MGLVQCEEKLFTVRDLTASWLSRFRRLHSGGCVKYLKACAALPEQNKSSSVCTGEDQYFWRMTWKKDHPPPPPFSGPRRQIKVETQACCHGDDSRAFSLFLILVSEMWVETSWGLLVCEDFDSYHSVFSGEAPLFAATLLFICELIRCRWDNETGIIRSQPFSNTR